MPEPPLTSIEIAGFTSIQSAVVDLGRLNVLVGANGAGKSNFIRAFELLGRLVVGELNYFVNLNGGASALANNADTTSRIAFVLNRDDIGYAARLVTAANNELIFDEEMYVLPGSGPHMRGGHKESVISTQEPRVAQLLRGCKVFHFHDTSLDAPVKRQVSTADNISLRGDAGNLAAVLLALQHSEDKKDQAAYRQIVGTIRLVAPFFRDFVLQPEAGTDYVRLRWQESGSDAVFSANQMSDGTLRFVCLATLLLQPTLPTLVVLDEPELGLHPYAIVQLADMLRQASTRSQVLIATQSVTLMNQFGVEDLIVVERGDTGSAFARPNPDRLRAWLDDYSLGELWEKNLIGGQPGSRGNVTDA